MHTRIVRGDIFIADLDPVIGSEQGGIRPVLIIQNDIGNQYSPTVIVASITTKTEEKSNLPTHYYIENESGLDKPSMVLLEQLRTIDKIRLKDYVCHLSDYYLNGVDAALSISVDL